MDANGRLCGADPPEQVGDTFAATVPARDFIL